jgi:hypothetical protein
MAIDSTSGQDTNKEGTGGTHRDAGIIIAFVVMALLAIGEFTTWNKLGSIQEAVKADETQLRSELTTQVNDRLTAMENSNAQVVEAMKKDLDNVGKRTGSNQSVLRREKKQIAELADLQTKQGDELKQEISGKADEKEVGALTQDVSSTRSDLDNTKKEVDATRSDLGMARSEFGTLIARNHDDIETLRKLGERDYFEFTLTRNKLQKVAGIGLTLKATNVKHHQYNLILNADDMNILKKARTVNEPIFFYTAGSKRAFELTVNSVQSGQVKGYVSTPKGATSEVASRGEGAR